MEPGKENLALQIRQQLAALERELKAAKTPEQKASVLTQRRGLLEKLQRVTGERTFKTAESLVKRIEERRRKPR